MSKQWIEELKKIIPESRIRTEDNIRRQKAQDLYALRMYQTHRGWEPTLPQAVVEVASEAEVAEVLRFCNARQIPVIPYSGGSGVLGGAECRDSGAIVLDLAGLDEIKELNEHDLMITVGAGVKINELEAYVRERGYQLGHYPQSIDQARMGGLAATRSIGQFSTLYGGIEHMLYGMRVVLADGDIVIIKPSPRKSVGPDLAELFMGSEGIYGIITEVTVALFPIPEANWKQAYRVTTMREGFELIRQIMQAGVKPAVVRLHDWLECEKPYGAFMEEDENLLILWCEGTPEKVAYEQTVIERIIGDKAIAAGSKPVDIWYEHRNDAADEYEHYGEQGLLVDTLEVSAPWSVVADLYEEGIDAVYYAVPELLYLSGHSSHSYPNGTNIYFQIGAFPDPTEGPDAAAEIYQKIWRILEEEALKKGADIAHHHGIGKQRVPFMAAQHGRGLGVMQAIKNALDPAGILNPGTVLPTEEEA